MTFLVWRAWRELDASEKLTRWVVLSLFTFSLADLALLAGLPLLNLSYIPVEPDWIANILLRAAPFLLLGVLFKRLKARQSRDYSPSRIWRMLTVLWVLNLTTYPIIVYGAYFEPFNLRLSRVEVSAPAFIPGRPLRIIHLSDLHVERTTIRERRLLEMVGALEPDLVILTGDYVHIDRTGDPLALAHTRALLDGLNAPYGVYAVTGSHAVDVPGAVEAVFQDSHVMLLRDQAISLQFEGGDLYLVGVSLSARERDAAVLVRLAEEIPADAFKLLLYHTPGLEEPAAKSGIDLYLAGHTHGGQYGLPFVSTIIKNANDIDYIQGQHTIGSMTLYISRGVGMEGLGYPRMRINKPPEVVLIELGPGD